MRKERYVSAARACQHRRTDSIDDALERVVLRHPLALSFAAMAALYVLFNILGYVYLGIVPGWMR